MGKKLMEVGYRETKYLMEREFELGESVEGLELVRQQVLICLDRVFTRFVGLFDVDLNFHLTFLINEVGMRGKQGANLIVHFLFCSHEVNLQNEIFS